MKLIANETIFYRSPDPAGLYCYTPWIDHGFNGRLVASFDIAGKSLCLYLELASHPACRLYFIGC